MIYGFFLSLRLSVSSKNQPIEQLCSKRPILVGFVLSSLTEQVGPIEDIQEFLRMSAAKRKAFIRQAGQVIQLAPRTFPYFTLVSNVQDRVDKLRPAQLDNKFSDFHLNTNCISKQHNIFDIRSPGY
jgi:hypothetical protein